MQAKEACWTENRDNAITGMLCRRRVVRQDQHWKIQQVTPLAAFPPSSVATVVGSLATAQGGDAERKVQPPVVSGTCKHGRAVKVCHPAGHRQGLVSSRRSPWTRNTDRNAGGLWPV